MTHKQGLNYPIYISNAPQLTYNQFIHLSWQGIASYWISHRRMAIHSTETEVDIYFSDWRMIKVLKERYLKTEDEDNWCEFTSGEMYLVRVRKPENVKFVKRHWQRFFFKQEDEKEILFKDFDKEYDEISE